MMKVGPHPSPFAALAFPYSKKVPIHSSIYIIVLKKKSCFSRASRYPVSHILLVSTCINRFIETESHSLFISLVNLLLPKDVNIKKKFLICKLSPNKFRFRKNLLE